MSSRSSRPAGRPSLVRRARRAALPLLAPAWLACVVALAGCGPEAKPAATAVAPPASIVVARVAPADAGPPVVPLPAGVPDSPAGHQLAWVLAAIAQPPGEADVAARFTPEFAAKVPAAKMVAIFTQVGAEVAPLAIDGIERGASAESLAAVVHAGKAQAPADAAKMRIAVRVEAEEPFRIAGLLLSPVVETTAASSWDEVKTGLRAVAPRVGFLAAAITGGKCVSLADLEPKKPLALGSAFKLYVLDALAAQIAAGKHTWGDPIVIDDARKSLPSGDLRNEPAGTRFTVRQIAERMIAMSDNTAADHLLAFVGRGAVEEAVKASGHATPSRMVPFLSTRDVFALKLLASPDELDAYARADVRRKRALLETYEARDLSRVPLEDNGWKKPRSIDSVEWFASPEDLCKVMVSLKQYADSPATAPVGAILSLNPGIPDEKGIFEYVGYKGGSEPGVMDLTWLLRRKGDGAGPGPWLFLTAGFNDPNEVIDEAKALSAAATARNFLGR